MNSSMEAFIPISLFLCAAAVVIVALYLKLQKRKVESEEILAAIEKGVDVKFPENRKNRLLPGLMWLLIGLVVTAAMAVVVPEHGPSGIWIWGLVPVAVGAAYLIVYRIEEQGDSPKE